MKRKTVCFALLFLILVSNTAFAANWVYYGRSAIVRGNVFIDSDSVYKSGENASYWQLLVYDKPIGTAAKITTKYEVILAPARKYRIADSRYYLANNQEDKEMNEWAEADSTTGTWADSFVGDNIKTKTDFALKYAKEGQDPGVRPTP